MAVDIDSLQIEIEATSSDAASKIDQLATALTNLKSSAKGGAGLTSVINQLKKLQNAINNVDANSAALTRLSNTIKGMGGQSSGINSAASAMRNLSNTVKSARTDYSSLANNVNTVAQQFSRLPSSVRSSVVEMSRASAAMDKLSENRVSASLNEARAALYSTSVAARNISSSFNKNSESVKSLGTAFSSLPPQIQKAITAQARLSDLNKKSTKETSTLSKANQEASKSFNVLGSSISSAVVKFGAYYIAFRQAASYISDWITSANKYIENVNLFQVSMGEFYDEAYDYAMLVSDRLGIDPSEWMRNQGVFMSMANGFGLAREQAYALSEGLTELSYDLSSLYNEDVEQSALRLQSALSGEIEPIRRLGISISQATLQEYALAHGIDESVTSMTEQEKALLRSLVLMEGAARVGAIGDFAKTLESPANAMRVLRQEMTQLGRALGEVFLPIIVQIIPVVQAFVRVITEAVSALAMFLGFTMPEWDDSDWGSGVTSGLEETENAFGEAEKAAKEYNNAVLGIDELNIISPQAATGAGAGDNLSDWASGIEIPDIWDKGDISAIQTRVDEIEELIQGLIDRLAQPFKEFDFSRAENSLRDFINTVQEQIKNWDFAGALWSVWDEGVRAISAVGQLLISTITPILEALDIPAIGYSSLMALKSALGMLADAFASVTPGAQAFVEIGLVPIAEWIGDRIYTTLMWLSGQLDKIGQWFVGMEDTFTDLGIAVGELTSRLWDFVEPILTVAWDNLLYIWGRIVDTVLDIAENVVILTTHIADLSSGIYDLLDAAGVIDFIRNMAINTIDSITIRIDGFLTILQGIIDFIVGAFTLDWNKAWGGLQTVASGVLTFLSGLITKFFGADWLEKIENWWTNNVVPWFSIERWMKLGQQAIDGLFQGLSNLWGNVTSWGEGLLNDVKSVLGIASPSKLFRDEVGYYLGAGIAEGLTDSQGEIVSAAQSIADSVQKVFNGISYDPGTNYMELINEAKAAGDNAAAARYESQRNAKIAGEGITEYAPTYEFTTALEPTNEQLMVSNERLEGLNTLSTEGNTLSLAGNDLSTKRNDLLSTGLENDQTRYEEFVEMFQNTYEDYMGEFDNALSTVVANFTSLKGGIMSGFSQTYSEIREAASRIVASTDQIRINIYNTYVSSGFASGGYPEEGQMFIAREAGPELVGRIGSRSAVVNNDQIVESVSQGVYAAVTAAMQTDQGQGNGRNINLNVYLDGKQIRASMKKADREAGASIMSGGVRNG